MRITLSLDDGVLLAVKERARRENRTVGEVLSDLARQALTGRLGPPDANRAAASIHGFDPLPHRGGAISNALIDRLRDEEAGVRRALLDINVLLALLNSDHVDHRLARDWISAEIQHGWASCAITQNGFVRIICQPRYPSPVPPSQAMDLLAYAASTEHHEFWPCTISVLDSKLIAAKIVPARASLAQAIVALVW
jgi:toxin-antitoxin system PIN domain toxin